MHHQPALKTLTLISLALAAASCSHAPPSPETEKLRFPGEDHLSNIRQLTFGGTNAEAYWSFDGKWLSFQRKGFHDGPACDQIYIMRADGSRLQALTNEGRTTCAHFLPGNNRVLFSSTISAGPECPPDPDKSRGYVWPIFDSYHLYSVKRDGSDLRLVEPGAPRAYNAEATVCKDGSVVFTSDRDGDLELYRGKLDSFGTMTDVKRLTFTPGYDGGAFFSQDCSKIVWRTSRPKPGKELEEYQSLLKQRLVRPGKLELWIANADGSHPRQVTRVGAATFAPYFAPDAKRILFSSNPRDPRGRSFDIYSIRVDGTGLKRITFSDTFDSFPMFSPDGKRLAFSSNRNASRPHETNVFVADWVSLPEVAPSPTDSDPANRVAAWTQALMSTAEISKIVKQMEDLGGKVIAGKEGKLPLIAHFGKACGNTSRTTLVHGDLDDPVASAGTLEVAALLQESARKGNFCAAIALNQGSRKNEILSLLAKNRIRPQAFLSLSGVGLLEANAPVITVQATGQPSTEKRLRTTLEARCVALSLDCAFESTSLKGETLPGFVFTTRAAASLKRGELPNATGVVQLAELVALTAIGAASQ